MKVKEIENLIVTYSEVATENIADGVRYKDIANIIALGFEKLNMPDIMKSACQCCGETTIDYFNTKCKSCGTEHTYRQTD